MLTYDVTKQAHLHFWLGGQPNNKNRRLKLKKIVSHEKY